VALGILRSASCVSQRHGRPLPKQAWRAACAACTAGKRHGWRFMLLTRIPVGNLRESILRRGVSLGVALAGLDANACPQSCLFGDCMRRAWADGRRPAWLTLRATLPDGGDA